MMPFIPPKLAPWIHFGNDTVHLKPDAPDDVKPLFTKLKENIDKKTEDMFKF